jgi:Zn-dependent peptidase ImmA (M78 family)
MNIRQINMKVTLILSGFLGRTLPIPIEEIARSRGLKVIPYPLGEDVSGLLSIENGQGTIGYNQEEPKVRRRFTVAHELGHFELHRELSHLFVDKQFIYRSMNSKNTPVNQVMEVEANTFASAILMPTELVRREVDNIQIDLANEVVIKELAAKFEVSVFAMSIRLKDLGFL